MEQAELITQAINLTLFGMGFVFLFLTLMVFVTKFMSIIVQKNQDTNNNNDINQPPQETEINEETKYVIEQAIKMHTGA